MHSCKWSLHNGCIRLSVRTAISTYEFARLTHWLPSIGSDCIWLNSMNLNGLPGAKLTAATDSLSISTGLKCFQYLEKDVTWVTPENSQVWFTVLKNTQICPLSPCQNSWIGRHIFVLVESRRPVKLFAFAASIWTINLFALVASWWTVYFLCWWVGELCIFSGGE